MADDAVRLPIDFGDAPQEAAAPKVLRVAIKRPTHQCGLVA